MYVIITNFGEGKHLWPALSQRRVHLLVPHNIDLALVIKLVSPLQQPVHQLDARHRLQAGVVEHNLKVRLENTKTY